MRLPQICAAGILCMLLVVVWHESTTQSRKSEVSNEAAPHDVLILDAPDEFRGKGCEKLVVWDDAASAYYNGRGLPSRYCKWEVGEKVIPQLEQMRRNRGLPPGSYVGQRKELERLRALLQEKEEMAKRLNAELERLKQETARDPKLKRAHESIDYLSKKYNVAGVACSRDYSKLEECRQGEPLPPLPPKECLEYLKKGGYDDPCPAFAGHR